MFLKTCRYTMKILECCITSFEGIIPLVYYLQVAVWYLCQVLSGGGNLIQSPGMLHQKDKGENTL